EVACARAARLVQVNGAQLDDCRVTGGLAQARVIEDGAAGAGPEFSIRVHRAVAGHPDWVAHVSADAGLVPGGE
ncbi:MAG: hypothetical protein WA962_04215, partial [Ornithinimicrobium sp.]